ncbi:hypothetical protein AVEN_120685-1 [Araneus ventricosus]|uniref:Uncharacterized protein n=1 Tax=Araneus ventricosus TaxID=182803 RepID=A0A4Y2WAG7_ARAVE|nr:hypothetical protein AVEN_120685-1 [Araneus ventricosus]
MLVPYKVLFANRESFTVQIGKPTSVSIDRLKAAHLFFLWMIFLRCHLLQFPASKAHRGSKSSPQWKTFPSSCAFSGFTVFVTEGEYLWHHSWQHPELCF